jgi:hypothetical protein
LIAWVFALGLILSWPSQAHTYWFLLLVSGLFLFLTVTVGRTLKPARTENTPRGAPELNPKA